MCPSNEDIIYVGFKGVLVLGMGLHFACVCVRILPVYFRSFSIGQGNCIMLKFNGDSYLVWPSFFRMHCGSKDLYVKLQYSTTSAMNLGMLVLIGKVQANTIALCFKMEQKISNPSLWYFCNTKMFWL